MGTVSSSSRHDDDYSRFLETTTDELGWTTQKIAEYPHSEWTNIKQENTHMGFDHCTSCTSSVFTPFYWGNCHGLHREENLKAIKLSVYCNHLARRATDREIGLDHIVKFSLVSCSWEAAVFHVRVKGDGSAENPPTDKLLFYRHRDDVIVGVYALDGGASTPDVYVSPSADVFILQYATRDATASDAATGDELTRTTSSFKCVRFKEDSTQVNLDEVNITTLHHEPVVLVFDPRYSHRRVACYVPTSPKHSHTDCPNNNTEEVNSPRVAIYDIDDRNVIRSKTIVQIYGQKSQKPLLAYSPDGAVISLLVKSLIQDEINLYDSDSLIPLCRLHCCFHADVPRCCFPGYSVHGNYISVPNRSSLGRCVEIYRISTQVPTLQTLSRATLIRKLDRNRIDALPLPKQIISYLKFDFKWE